MKVVLGLIAIIIIVLAAYVAMGLDGKQHVQKTVSKALHSEDQVSQVVPTEITSEKLVRPKVDTPKKITTPPKKATPSLKSSTKIHDDELTTEEEYTPNVDQTSDEPINDKEWNAIEKQMIESGQISQEGDSSASTENLGYDPSELTR